MNDHHRPAARRTKPSAYRAWLRQHRDSIRDTFTNLRSNRSAVILSVLVIGFTLSLPLGLHVLQNNFLNVVVGLGSQPQASLFLETNANRDEAEALANSLSSDARIDEVRIIDKSTALAEFAEASNMREVIASLAENPLPYTIVVTVGAGEFEGEKGMRLQRELEELPHVAHAQFDITWIRRLGAIADVAARTAAVFAVILSIGVVLITGNTIRVGIHGRRDEIEVAKLCGATDAFVRRPFLYSGAVQGLFGAVVALTVVAGAVASLSGPSARLAALYGSDLQLINISIFSILTVLVSGAALGLIGAWIAVAIYLRQIDLTRGV